MSFETGVDKIHQKEIKPLFACARRIMCNRKLLRPKVVLPHCLRTLSNCQSILQSINRQPHFFLPVLTRVMIWL